MASHINVDLYEDRNDLINLRNNVKHFACLLDEALKAQTDISDLLKNIPVILDQCKTVLDELIGEVE